MQIKPLVTDFEVALAKTQWEALLGELNLTEVSMLGAFVHPAKLLCGTNDECTCGVVDRVSRSRLTLST